MKGNENQDQRRRFSGRIVLFLAGLFCLTCVIVFLATVQPPPGIAGDVLRNNLEHEIDATPLIYSEYDGMLTLEENLRRTKHSLQMAQD